MLELFIRYFHFIAIFALISCLVAENILVATKVSRGNFNKLARVDSIYGGAAGSVLILGLILWFGVGKPAAFYNANPLFHVKVTLFFITGACTIYPTIFINRNRGTSNEEVEFPNKVIWLMRFQFIPILIMPLLAVMMARGIGM